MCENMLIQVINNRQNKVDTCGLVDAKKNKKTVNRSMSLQAVEVELPVCNGGILNHPTSQVLIGFPAQSYLQPEGDKRAHAPHVCRLLKKKRRCQTHKRACRLWRLTIYSTSEKKQVIAKTLRHVRCSWLVEHVWSGSLVRFPQNTHSSILVCCGADECWRQNEFLIIQHFSRMPESEGYDLCNTTRSSNVLWVPYRLIYRVCFLSRPDLELWAVVETAWNARRRSPAAQV